MDVFVIPRGANRYALYCEAGGGEEVADTAPRGIVGRLKHAFVAMLRAVERHEVGEAVPEEPGWWGRTRQWLLRWVTERVAEQRLLWRLRRESHVTAVHPEDMLFVQVRAVIDRELRRDRERHRKGLIIFTVALILSGLVAVVPGPNLIAYYFAFCVVGHWLSLRGAVHGQRHVQWSGQACPELLALREAVGLSPADREARVRDVAYRLRLPRLPKFFARVAV